MLTISIKKQRNIPISKMGLTGGISSVKENRMVEFESSLERDFIQIIEFDSKVFFYCEQPIKIYYKQDEISHYYTPDFYIEYFNGEKEIIEIKYEEDLRINKLIYDYKFRMADEFCELNGISFKILTEKDIRNFTLFNARFLLNYKIPKFGLVQYDRGIIYEILDKHDELTVRDLISKTSLDKYRQAEMLYLLWYMVANYWVKIDLSQKISMDSIITKNKLYE